MSDETVEWLGVRIPRYGAIDFETFKTPSKTMHIPLFNNFFLFFAEGWGGDIYRKAPAYKKLQEEHPEIVKKASKALNSKETRGSPEWTEKVAPALYEAYKLMNGYTFDGKKVSNYPDLFG